MLRRNGAGQPLRTLPARPVWECLMPPATHPANEAERLAALRSYAILDTGCEASFDILSGFAARLPDRAGLAGGWLRGGR